MELSKEAKDCILSSNKLMGRLMGLFDRGQKSLQDWIGENDIRLTTPSAVKIIKEESGLSEDEILVDIPVQA